MRAVLFLIAILSLSLGFKLPRSSGDFFDKLIEEVQKDWEQFKVNHGKDYKSDAEEGYRKTRFLKNREFVKNHNEKFQNGETTFQVELNQFSDLSDKEHDRMNGFRASKGTSLLGALRVSNETLFRAPLNSKIPESIDWREHGYVTPVKYQGHCGSCWAFSATGALEGQHKRATGKLVSLSEQNLVDCVPSWLAKQSVPLDVGCKGSFPWNAFRYIQNNGGVDTESSYPYTAGLNHTGGKCHFSKTFVGATDKGFYRVPEGNEEALKIIVATKGPVSVGVHSDKALKMYSEGVFYNFRCKSGANDLNHAVLVVGYGTDSKLGDYWIVKNSWGKRYGEKGYVRMARNRENHCGIATSATMPIV
ncbi:hypothetical protein L596_029656 [Steinernema carpocapsae]|uniref:Cathepsin L-like n=1 Tax=Steinernema carpocapsae TaxID=34508 RepID=A0A4U5LVA3_STECR|nr:hypothetical protein L596_029656 [Steinernema carpocapsae]